jgi:hypothetical protein
VAFIVPRKNRHGLYRESDEAGGKHNALHPALFSLGLARQL